MDKIRNGELRICKVIVNNLFERFNYKIDFQNRDNVSILIAPNGCGKTTIFNFLNFIIDPKIDTLLPIVHVPFESFSCHLSNGLIIELSKSNKAIEISQNSTKNIQRRVKNETPDLVSLESNKWWNWDFLITVKKAKSKGKTYDFFKFNEKCEKDPVLLRGREENIENDIAGFSFLIDYLNFDGSEQMAPRLYAKCSLVCEELQRFLAENKCQVSISFISANRLNPLNSLAKISPHLFRFRYGFFPMPSEKAQFDVLQKARNDTSELIKKAVGKYSNLVAEAKNKLPQMYLQSPNETEHDFDAFKNRWNTYHKELKKYNNIGLLNSADEVIKSEELKKSFEKKGQFLVQYLNAFEETLTPLEEIYKKIKLFSDIFSKRNEITHKNVKFSSEGIDITVDNRPLDIHFLSSGEKNDFIMFFQLIFKAQQNSIVLIDEPEISLHIKWQEEYIDRLIEICSLNSIQAIVATHSPNIVSGHIELYAKWEFARQ